MCAPLPKIQKQITKTFYFDSLRTFKVKVDTPQNSSSIRVTTRSTSTSICNLVHTGRSNNGKIRTFYGGKVKKVKGAMPQLGRRRGAHLPLAAVEPVGG